MEMMTPKHPRWNEFIGILLGPEGCDVTTNDDEEAGFTWQCDGDFRRAEAVLETMGGFKLKESFDDLNRVFAACCDCNILDHCADERLKQWLRSH